MARRKTKKRAAPRRKRRMGAVKLNKGVLMETGLILAGVIGASYVAKMSNKLLPSVPYVGEAAPLVLGFVLPMVVKNNRMVEGASKGLMVGGAAKLLNKVTGGAIGAMDDTITFTMLNGTNDAPVMGNSRRLPRGNGAPLTFMDALSGTNSAPVMGGLGGRL